jgi:hypothetical protein
MTVRTILPLIILIGLILPFVTPVAVGENNAPPAITTDPTPEQTISPQMRMMQGYLKIETLHYSSRKKQKMPHWGVYHKMHQKARHYLQFLNTGQIIHSQNRLIWYPDQNNHNYRFQEKTENY